MKVGFHMSPMWERGLDRSPATFISECLRPSAINSSTLSTLEFLCLTMRDVATDHLEGSSDPHQPRAHNHRRIVTSLDRTLPNCAQSTSRRQCIRTVMKRSVALRNAIFTLFQLSRWECPNGDLLRIMRHGYLA